MFPRQTNRTENGFVGAACALSSEAIEDALILTAAPRCTRVRDLDLDDRKGDDWRPIGNLGILVGIHPEVEQHTALIESDSSYHLGWQLF